MSTCLPTMSHFYKSILQTGFATMIPLFLCLKTKKKYLLFSNAHNTIIHSFIKTTCCQTSDVASQFFQNRKVLITLFPQFKHIQLLEFSLRFGYCHLLFYSFADISYFFLCPLFYCFCLYWKLRQYIHVKFKMNEFTITLSDNFYDWLFYNILHFQNLNQHSLLLSSIFW